MSMLFWNLVVGFLGTGLMERLNWGKDNRTEGAVAVGTAESVAEREHTTIRTVVVIATSKEERDSQVREVGLVGIPTMIP